METPHEVQRAYNALIDVHAHLGALASRCIGGGCQVGFELLTAAPLDREDGAHDVDTPSGRRS